MNNRNNKDNRDHRDHGKNRTVDLPHVGPPPIPNQPPPLQPRVNVGPLPPRPRSNSNPNPNNQQNQRSGEEVKIDVDQLQHNQPLPIPPPRGKKSVQIKPPKEEIYEEEEEIDEDDVNPSYYPRYQDERFDRFGGNRFKSSSYVTPLKPPQEESSKKISRPPLSERIEQITDENERKQFETMRAAVLSVSTFAGHVSENIDKFFKYNKDNLVRPHIKVDEIEIRKARTWVFFLILIQFIVCAAFLLAVIFLQLKGLPYAGYFFAGTLLIYFILRLFSVAIFVLRRGTKNSNCCAGSYNPDNERYEDVFICIPAYNEEKEAFMNTISSISATNYPKHKMYMFFIVDGNKANCFENLMECLYKKPFEQPVPPKSRMLKHGVYEGIPYSVFLKEENRGKRDSQWLFVELLRNMIPEFAPTYVFFVDSDTGFHPDSLRFMVENFGDDKKIAGVCGKLTLSNFKFWGGGIENSLYFCSTMFIVGFQFYEYHYNQLVGKQSEAAFSAVSCLPGAFSVFRANVLTNVETTVMDREDEVLPSQVMDKMGAFSLYYYKIKQTLPLIKDDFFSKPCNGIVKRNLYELGEDRTLTIRFLERGLKCLYEPRAVAYTECPDSIVKYFQQRRRWNNSTFVNLAAILTKGSLWCQLRTIPIQIFSLMDLFGAYIMPVNAILLMYAIWDPMFQFISERISGWITESTGKIVTINISTATVIAALLIIQAVVIVCTSLNTADMFYVFSTFITGLLMLVSFPFFIIFCIDLVKNFIDDMSGNFAPIIILALFPLLHIIMSITNPLAFFTVIYYWAMIPTSAFTLPLYSFVHLDDFSWGNR